jgi:hypothetical protein
MEAMEKRKLGSLERQVPHGSGTDRHPALRAGVEQIRANVAAVGSKLGADELSEIDRLAPLDPV